MDVDFVYQLLRSLSAAAQVFQSVVFGYGAIIVASVLLLVAHEYFRTPAEIREFVVSFLEGNVPTAHLFRVSTS
jgi:hypothetical protein